ncbi:MAG: hypothetical protein DRJ03_24165 [Chloroflexi bacterium]|nr:MAG: hypothetical protein DRJ03_24165 [Chloroflexota bacterium]
MLKKLALVILLLATLPALTIANSNLAYVIDATNGNFQSSATWRSITPTNIILGRESIDADFSTLHTTSSTTIDTQSLALNTTLTAAASPTHIISSHSLTQNFFSCHRNNNTINYGSSGFYASGPVLVLSTEASVGPALLAHGVTGTISGSAGIGFSSQDNSTFSRRTTHVHAHTLNITALAEWHDPVYPGAAVPNTSISRLCVWQSQPPIYPWA